MSKKSKRTARHLNCKHVRPYTRAHLANKSHKPVLAECLYRKDLFPIDELTECEYYECANRH